MKKEIKYLSVTFSEKLGYKRHLKVTYNKVTVTVIALSRLMPNIDGPTQKKRQILMTVAINQLMYAAPIWSTALKCGNKLCIIENPLRRTDLRVACAYRTVFTQAILIVAGVPNH